MNRYVKQYKISSVETASREQILIMLYEGAIKFLNEAKTAMQNNDIETSHNKLISAQNIIQEFIDSMDREVAPQLAENLISLYEYFIRRLIFANIKRQIAPINEVLKYLTSLKATWEKAIILAQKEQQNSSYDSYDSSDIENESYENSDEDDDDDDADDVYEVDKEA